MKLKVLRTEDTPKNCTRRVVVDHDDSDFKPWPRDEWDHTFLLWSNSRNHRGDTVWNKYSKKRVEVDSPFEPEIDEEGYETGNDKPKDGLIIIPVDIYEHSGTVWFLRGHAPIGCRCQFDSTCFNNEAPFYLYCDKDRWEKYCGNCPWEWIDGKPSDKLMTEATKVASSEVKEMNMAETDSYYCWDEQEKITETADVTVNNEATGERKNDHRVSVIWDSVDSCGLCMTEDPLKDLDFPVGCPVVTDNSYLVGSTFSQECYALKDDATGKYVRFANEVGIKFKLVDDPADATLWGSGQFPSSNRKGYEEDCKKSLTVVDVSELVWSKFKECRA